MAEPLLTLAYGDIQTEVASLLGWNAASFATGQEAVVDRYIQSGYRRFLHPPSFGENEPPHEWSFLCPAATLAITDGDYDIDLPDDFGWIVGTFHYAPDVTARGIEMVGAGKVMELRQGTTVTNDPYYAGIRPKTLSTTTGSRWEAVFFPEPSNDRTLHYRYRVLEAKLGTDTGEREYPLGGPEHSETVLECCLAVAEQREDDVAGLHTALADRMVKDSIRRDRAHAPDYLGYNGDRSDGVSVEGGRIAQWSYNGMNLTEDY